MGAFVVSIYRVGADASSARREDSSAPPQTDKEPWLRRVICHSEERSDEESYASFDKQRLTSESPRLRPPP